MKEDFNSQQKNSIENEKVEKITVESFSKYLKNVEEIPDIVQKYLDMKGKVDGENFKIVVGGKNEDTGYGMSYYSDYTIFDSTGKELFNSGLRLYRSGLPNAQDHWDQNIGDMKIIDENPKKLTFGWSGGTGVINIKECTENGKVSSVENFDLAKRKKTLENQTEPIDEESFKKWVRNYINTERVDTDIKHQDENLCIAIARHANQPFNATHDWYQLFAWLKGKGVAIGDKKWTGGRSASFGDSNYFRPTITVDGNKINLKGRSQYGDVNIEENYIFTEKELSKDKTK